MAAANQTITLSQNKINFRNINHGSELCNQTYKYFKNQTLCDIIIKTNQSTPGNKICAHRLVLASFSGYFADVAMNRIQLENPSEVVIENISEELLRKIIEYCYTGRLEVENSQTCVEELLNKARYFKIKFLEETCIKLLINHSLSAVLGVYRLYSLEEYPAELREKLFKIICVNFMKLYKSDDFLRLSADKLANIIAHDNIRVESEKNVLDTLLAWLNYNFDERKQHVGQLLPLIRFPFLTPSHISNHVKPICKTLENMKLLAEALEWQNVPKNRAALGWISTKNRNLAALIIIIGNGQPTDAAKFIEVYNPTRNKRYHCDILPTGRTYFVGIAAAVMDYELIVAGGYDENTTDLKTVHKLDLTSMTWLQLPSMLTARRFFKLIVLQHKLYAVGGEPYTNTVECWDPTNNVWKYVSAMSAKRSQHSVIELDNKLYALGGYDDINILSSVECYDPNLDKWTAKASMNQERMDAGVGILNGFLYVIGGSLWKDSEWFAVNSIERYDTKADKWTVLHTIDDKTARLKCISLHNYFIGTSDPNDSTEIVKYDPGTNKITTLHVLKYKRFLHEVLAISHINLSKFRKI